MEHKKLKLNVQEHKGQGDHIKQSWTLKSSNKKTYQFRVFSLNFSPNACCFLRASCTLNSFYGTLHKWIIKTDKFLGLQIRSNI